MYFYRSLAYRKLGDEKKAIGGFNTLINYCEEHIDDKPEIDYFAAFLPDFLCSTVILNVIIMFIAVTLQRLAIRERA